MANGLYAVLGFFSLLVFIAFVGCGESANSTVDDDRLDTKELRKSSNSLKEKYIVVDISEGVNAKKFHIKRHNSVPTDLLTNASGINGSNVYKTSKIVLRKISAGTFIMGSPVNEIGRFPDEVEHEVSLTRSYYISVFEITQRQYELVMGVLPSVHTGDLRPVENVSWGDVRGGDWPGGTLDPNSSSFMGVLQSKTNFNFDLPTEAQWEYACRAESTKAYNNNSDSLVSDSQSDVNLEPLAWYSANSLSLQHHEVGLKESNAWGLFDMHGNVFELCLDRHGNYIGIDEVDPVGSFVNVDRVIRGGGWGNFARYSRSALRRPVAANYPHRGTGFRLACAAKGN